MSSIFYKAKPVEIEALEWKGSNIREMLEFYPEVVTEESDEGECLIKIETLEGVMTANVGDYIIKGTLGEYYPCKPEAFHNKYEVLK
jgi:hypothetical protein